MGDSYTLGRELGGGGMSRVFVATENTLGRQVAIKVFPSDSSATVSIERFKREIQVAAALQHPHIVPLLTAGETGGVPFYTMPFVKGESLRQRLDKGGELSVKATMHILHDVAAALAYAHGEGVVHRDIKPENIMLSGGVAVVTDFGVAKAMDLAASDGGRRTTLTSRSVALGTPAYMAPEQASADPQVDHRADIYAFGCVAYEMLAGASPFAGRPAQQLLAAQVAQVPDELSKRRPNVQPGLASLVMSCLEKRPGDRPQSADELLARIDAIGTPSEGMVPVSAGATSLRISRRAAYAIGATALVLLVAGVVLRSRTSDASPPTRGAVTPVAVESALQIEPAISPNGTQVAFAKATARGYRIFVKQIDGGPARPLTTDPDMEQRGPHWNHDGSRVSFVAGRAVYVAPAGGGAALRFIEDARDHDWSRDGRSLVFIRHGDLWRADSVGGAQRVVRVVKGAAYMPALSPDGKWIAYMVGNAPSMTNLSTSRLWIVSSDSGAKPIAISDTLSMNLSPVWSPDGRSVLYISNVAGARDVYQQAIGPDRRPRGQPVQITTNLGSFVISLSSDGTRMAFDIVRPLSNIVRADIPPTGEIRIGDATRITVESQHIEALGLSGTGEWLAYDSDHNGKMQIYKMRAEGGDPIALTSDASNHFFPSWSGDSEIVFFAGHGKRVMTVGAQGGASRYVTHDPRQGWDMNPDWSPDGTKIVFWGMEAGAWRSYREPRAGTGQRRRHSTSEMPQRPILAGRRMVAPSSR